MDYHESGCWAQAGSTSTSQHFSSHCWSLTRCLLLDFPLLLELVAYLLGLVAAIPPFGRMNGLYYGSLVNPPAEPLPICAASMGLSSFISRPWLVRRRAENRAVILRTWVTENNVSVRGRLGSPWAAYLWHGRVPG